jgi:hypothetical protein
MDNLTDAILKTHLSNAGHVGMNIRLQFLCTNTSRSLTRNVSV